MKKLFSKLIQPATFVIIGAFARILPHPANFAPIAAMALFGGVYMGKKQAFILPILAMVFSDLLIGFDSLPMRLTIYGTFLATVLVGLWLKDNKNTKNIILASLFSSILFFVVTNFAVWAFGGMYSKNLLGLSESYVLAIPFFRNTILGDLFYSGVLFGGYEFVKNLIKNHRLSPIEN
jgi:hypothetical protein